MQSIKRQNDTPITYNIGDAIKVKGIEYAPNMIINEVGREEGITAFWFDNDNCYQERTFDTDTIERIEGGAIDVSMTNLPIGAIVKLESDDVTSPMMVVKGFGSDNTIITFWFDYNNKYHERTFDAEVLKRVPLWKKVEYKARMSQEERKTFYDKVNQEFDNAIENHDDRYKVRYSNETWSDPDLLNEQYNKSNSFDDVMANDDEYKAQYIKDTQDIFNKHFKNSNEYVFDSDIGKIVRNKKLKRESYEPSNSQIGSTVNYDYLKDILTNEVLDKFFNLNLESQASVVSAMNSNLDKFRDTSSIDKLIDLYAKFEKNKIAGFKQESVQDIKSDSKWESYVNESKEKKDKSSISQEEDTLNDIVEHAGFLRKHSSMLDDIEETKKRSLEEFERNIRQELEEPIFHLYRHLINKNNLPSFDVVKDVYKCNPYSAMIYVDDVAQDVVVECTSYHAPTGGSFNKSNGKKIYFFNGDFLDSTRLNYELNNEYWKPVGTYSDIYKALMVDSKEVEKNFKLRYESKSL